MENNDLVLTEEEIEIKEKRAQLRALLRKDFEKNNFRNITMVKSEDKEGDK